MFIDLLQHSYGIPATDRAKSGIDQVFIDAGTRHFRLQACADDGSVILDTLLPSNCDLNALFEAGQIGGHDGQLDPAHVFITGKLANAVQERLGGGKLILPAAAFWFAAQNLVKQPGNVDFDSIAMVDLSASGYLVIGVDRNGMLKDDLLVTNPRCGAGSGINLDRVLQKLDVRHEEVDSLLAAYLGDSGRARRDAAAVRVDRCGVFSTSATISDKNQGIPLDVALATTLKSEVMKTVKKLPPGFDKVYLTGRIFRWDYARDCAEDLLRAQGAKAVEFDSENTHTLNALRALVSELGGDGLAQPDPRLVKSSDLEEYPAFSELLRRYETTAQYRRLPDESRYALDCDHARDRALILALDVGSTMAKVALAEAGSGQILFLDAYSNAGDTIETVKKVFRDLQRIGFEKLSLQSVGVTGSARYQVQQALSRIYPGLSDRVSVLVENYAHARGSIDCAKGHIKWLEKQGVQDVNKDLCILVDIGGEDTKISTIALNEAELFDNAMNTKCSAGTGSLMDTLSAMFAVENVAEAQGRAFEAPRSFAINATCAVFLMENASKLQARGVARDEILASANWAIVENMARTLWSQLDLPSNAVVLLHGQTMLSDPLPLAVTHRLRVYQGANVYALIPPHPGHRACIGLIRTLQQAAIPGHETINPDDLLDAQFDKRVIQCKGAVCGDPMARCNRCALRWQGDDGRKIAFTVGGCTAINELISHKGRKKAQQPRDTYKEIWEFIDNHHPRSDDPNRLVIPRSFAVSEWAFFLSRLFQQLGIPVHVDNVRDTDLADAQPQFNVDCCAPQMGAVGQYRRLAAASHGMILAPQIETLPTGGASRGLTCTANQGGVAVAKNLAELDYPQARFHLFHINIDALDAGGLCDQLLPRLAPVFQYYGVDPDGHRLQRVIGQALDDHRRLRQEAADLAADMIEQALEEGIQVALVVGREYVLNPGIYDSHVRRLLRDRQMTVIPSYVLDVELDPEYARIYWRNPHFILTLLKAVAHRALHRRLRHPKLRSLFQRMEQDPAGSTLPVVQVSTFSCGPDSIIAHYVAEIMKERPFLLIQSDAVLKELAHLENRVNTYVKQLQQGLHDKFATRDDEGHFEVRRLDELLTDEPLNPKTDVICLPTLADNRVILAVLRAAGFCCIDNYVEDDYDLQALVKAGRKAAGQTVCTPLAALYADLKNGVDEFTRRKQAGDPALIGKRRLVLFDSQGPGPCRQGQYPGLHRLFFQKSTPARQRSAVCNSLPGGALFEFMVVEESEGYRAGFDEWITLRMYQGLILKGILQSLLFKGGSACRDFDEYQHFLVGYRALQTEIYRLLESYTGPGRFGRRLLRMFGDHGLVSVPLKYFIYRLHGGDFVRPLKRFVTEWLQPDSEDEQRLDILITGEGYMRLAQADEIFRILLGTFGFRRFNLELSPAMSFLELLLEEAADKSRQAIDVARARASRTGGDADVKLLEREAQKLRTVRLLRFLLRKVLAHPLYKASGLQMPPAAAEAIVASRELLPTSRPIGELAPYIGEALIELRHGADVVLNVAPNGCMVASMGEALTPSIMHAEGVQSGRIQTLLSAEGDVNEELLTLAVLKATGPRRYYEMRHNATA